MENVIKTKDEWEKEYVAGDWDTLGDPLEKARHAVIAMYCNHFHPKGTVLDIGCGEAVLYDFLTPAQKEGYIGIDLSEAAVAIAKHRRNATVLAVDASLYESSKKFDIIIFNEVIYYLDYKHVVSKYDKLLNENGILIVSMSKSHEAEERSYELGIWNVVRSTFNSYENIELLGKTEDFTWTWEVEVLKKKSSN